MASCVRETSCARYSEASCMRSSVRVTTSTGIFMPPPAASADPPGVQPVTQTSDRSATSTQTHRVRAPPIRGSFAGARGTEPCNHSWDIIQPFIDAGDRACVAPDPRRVAPSQASSPRVRSVLGRRARIDAICTDGATVACHIDGLHTNAAPAGQKLGDIFLVHGAVYIHHGRARGRIAATEEIERGPPWARAEDTRSVVELRRNLAAKDVVIADHDGLGTQARRLALYRRADAVPAERLIDR